MKSDEMGLGGYFRKGGRCAWAGALMLLKGASLPESMGRSPTQAQARAERRCHFEGVHSLVERCRNGLCTICAAVICAVAVVPILPAAVLAVTVIITPLPKWSLLVEDAALCRGILASQHNC